MPGQRDNSLSVVIPFYRESENVSPMLEVLHKALESLDIPWEIICVDDGSDDDTAECLRREIAHYGNHVRLVALSRNYGQTTAMQAGIDHARGKLIATLDADLQNDPADIPRMLEELEDRKLDLLAGWRKNRQDPWLHRRFPSILANALIGKVTGVRLHDYGCSLKIFRADVAKRIRLFGEMHRFIPVWMATVTRPDKIAETVVNHSPRLHGQSKYGLSRTFRVVLDLLAVFFFLRFRARPGHFFGSIGLLLAGIASLISLYLGFLKFGQGLDIGHRPLFYLDILFWLAGIQFLTTGVLAELLARTFFETRQGRAYFIDETGTDNPQWKTPDQAE